LSIVTAIGILLLPKATGLVVKKQNYYDFFIQYGRLILVTYTFAIVLFIGIGKELIFYWVGTDFVETYYITLIILLSSIGWRFQTPLFEMSRALKKHGKIAIINLFGATLNVLLAFVFVSRIGTIGTAFAIAIPVLIFNTLISTLIYKRMFKLDLHKYFQDIFNGIFPAFILSIIISILLSLLSYGSLFIQLTIYIVYLIAIIIVYYNLGVSTKEKLIIKNFLIEVVNHFRKKVR
jgi:O-antigen/teichoic acid export membrane protein